MHFWQGFSGITGFSPSGPPCPAHHFQSQIRVVWLTILIVEQAPVSNLCSHNNRRHWLSEVVPPRCCKHQSTGGTHFQMHLVISTTRRIFVQSTVLGLDCPGRKQENPMILFSLNQIFDSRDLPTNIEETFRIKFSQIVTGIQKVVTKLYSPFGLLTLFHISNMTRTMPDEDKILPNKFQGPLIPLSGSLRIESVQSMTSAWMKQHSDMQKKCCFCQLCIQWDVRMHQHTRLASPKGTVE